MTQILRGLAIQIWVDGCYKARLILPWDWSLLKGGGLVPETVTYLAQKPSNLQSTVWQAKTSKALALQNGQEQTTCDVLTKRNASTGWYFNQLASAHHDQMTGVRNHWRYATLILSTHIVMLVPLEWMHSTTSASVHALLLLKPVP